VSQQACGKSHWEENSIQPHLLVGKATHLCLVRIGSKALGAESDPHGEATTNHMSSLYTIGVRWNVSWKSEKSGVLISFSSLYTLPGQ
jgi:hypothetical protein